MKSIDPDLARQYLEDVQAACMEAYKVVDLYVLLTDPDAIECGKVRLGDYIPTENVRPEDLAELAREYKALAELIKTNISFLGGAEIHDAEQEMG